ncbi:hypothetical protein CgunFtcFv8_002914 [Champsocephalus gunnari]|uniref:Uncharacterized protein n=1 Tax=Champsocephalus gunnari TaxID=52237 RepID=A0AAN8D7Q1_CHAGU|nr:hypothetical protein CgunFtcFv8_002914 [Champsocephalus gunnari]
MISAPHGFSLGLQKTPKASILHAGSQNALWECNVNLCCDKADLLFRISGDGASRSVFHVKNHLFFAVLAELFFTW